MVIHKTGKQNKGTENSEIYDMIEIYSKFSTINH